MLLLMMMMRVHLSNLLHNHAQTRTTAAGSWVKNVTRWQGVALIFVKQLHIPGSSMTIANYATKNFNFFFYKFSQMEDFRPQILYFFKKNMPT